MKRKKKIICCFVVLLIFLAACSTTTIQSSWKDKNYKGSPIRKVLIIGLFKNEANRRIFESEFVRQFNSYGIDAVFSPQIMSEEDLTDKDVTSAKLRENDIDAVLLARKIGGKKGDSIESQLNSGMPYGYDGPLYDQSLVDDYMDIYGRVYGSTYMREDEIVVVETILYEVKDKKKIWTAVSDTYVIDNVDKLIKSAVKTLMKGLYDTKLFE